MNYYERIKDKKRGYIVVTRTPNPTADDPNAEAVVVQHVENLYRANKLKPKVKR